MKISRRAFFKYIKKELPTVTFEEIVTIERAYEFAKTAHAGQTRANGDPYFQGHCVPVAMHVIDLGMG